MPRWRVGFVHSEALFWMPTRRPARSAGSPATGLSPRSHALAGGPSTVTSRSVQTSHTNEQLVCNDPQRSLCGMTRLFVARRSTSRCLGCSTKGRKPAYQSMPVLRQSGPGKRGPKGRGDRVAGDKMVPPHGTNPLFLLVFICPTLNLSPYKI